MRIKKASTTRRNAKLVPFLNASGEAALTLRVRLSAQEAFGLGVLADRGGMNIDQAASILIAKAIDGGPTLEAGEKPRRKTLRALTGRLLAA